MGQPWINNIFLESRKWKHRALLDSSIHLLIWGHQSICRLSFPNFQPEKTMADDALRELWKGSPLSLQKLDGWDDVVGWEDGYGSVAVWTCRSLWSLITSKKFICSGIPPFFRVCHINACIVILMNRGKQVFFSQPSAKVWSARAADFKSAWDKMYAPVSHECWHITPLVTSHVARGVTSFLTSLQPVESRVQHGRRAVQSFWAFRFHQCLADYLNPTEALLPQARRLSAICQKSAQ